MTELAPRKKLSNGQTVALIVLGGLLLLFLLFSPIGCAYLKMRQIQDQIGAEQDAARAAQEREKVAKAPPPKEDGE